MKSKVVLILVFIVATLVTVISVFTKSFLKDIVIVLISLFGVIAVIFELKASADVARAEFVINLQDVYTQNSDFIELFEKCWENYLGKLESAELESYCKDHRTVLINYFTFFESIFLMLKQGVISMDTINDLFGRRFFIVASNKVVQDFDLAINSKYYLNVVELYEIWRMYREKMVCKSCNSSEEANAMRKDLFLASESNPDSALRDLLKAIE